ncbi:hypothetical protein BC833DRAFT_643759 [Globomyces pollinis-pini]|nr:hypothetical protein BC833DRAFT_643759 [Globomyces pollinis-pini]
MESLAASVVNKVLGDYIANLETNQLKIAVWEGNVSLKNLKLKSNLFAQWKIPLEVVYGCVGDLTITIPWKDLKNQPLKIAVNNVFILAKPSIEQSYDPEEEYHKQEVKQQKLKAWEDSILKPVETNNSYFSQMSSTMIDNLQISIKNIHIRYEDTISCPKNPFGVGFTLKELSAISSDSEWKTEGVSVNTGTIYKLLKLGHLGVYCSTDSMSFAKPSDKDTFELFSNRIANTQKVEAAKQYVLNPVSGVGKLTWVKTLDTSKPRCDLNMDFDDLAFNLDDHQYATFMTIFGTLTRQSLAYPYRKYRPPKAITPKLDPKAWFQYAGKCVLSDISAKRKQWTWEFFKERRDSRKRYIELYTLFRKGEIDEEEVSELDQLELSLSFDDIRFYRHITMSKYKFKEPAPPKKAEPKTSSWYSYITGGTSATEEDENDQYNQQLKRLYDSFEFDSVASGDENIPQDSVQFRITAHLSSGSLTLRRFHGKDIMDLIVSKFENLRMETLLYPQTISIEMLMQHFAVSEPKQSKSKYRTLMEAKHQPNEDEPTDFLKLKFEYKPLDGRADNALAVRMLPLKIILNPQILNKVFEFFKPEKDEADSLSQLQAVAQGALEGVSSQTKAGLMFAIEEHKTLDLNIEADAPIFFIPSSTKISDSPLLILDAGHLQVQSNLATDRTKEKARDSVTKSLSELQQDIYDKFTINLTAMKILVGRLDETSLDGYKEGDFLLENLDVKLLAELCILKSITEFAKFKLSAMLPRLHVNVSERKIAIVKRVMALLKRIFLSDTVNPAVQAAPVLLAAVETDLVFEDEDETKLTDSQASLIQTLFVAECHFHQASIMFQEDVGENDKPKSYALLEAKEILTCATLRSDGMKFTAALGSFIIEDLSKEALNDYRRLISPTISDIKFVNPKEILNPMISFKHSVETLPTEVVTDMEITMNPIKVILARECILRLYNFMMLLIGTTVVDVSATPMSTTMPKLPDLPPLNPKKSKMKLSVHINSIKVMFVEGSEELGSSNLDSFDISMTSANNLMVVEGTVGKLLLNEGIGAKRSMLLIEDDQAFNFKFQTYGADEQPYPGFNSSLHFKAASWRFLYDKYFISRFTNYLGKFQEMKLLMDSAREAAQKSSERIQETAGKFYFNMNIKTPIIDIPNGSGLNVDRLLLYLGEITASSVVEINSDDIGIIKDQFLVQFKNLKVVTIFNSSDDIHCLDMIEDTDLDIKIDTLSLPSLPNRQITVNLSDLNFNVTNFQYRLFIEVLQLISSSDSSIVTTEELQQAVQPTSSHYLIVIPHVYLEVFACKSKFDNPTEFSLARFIGNKVTTKVALGTNQPLDLELRFSSLSVIDTRSSNQSVFRDIMTPIAESDDQFVLVYRNMGKATEYSVTIDNAKLIFEIDHILSIRDFAVSAFYHEVERNVTPLSNAVANTKVPENTIKGRVSFVDAEIIIIEKPEAPNTNAMVWISAHLVITQDVVINISFQDLGMFFCVMDQRAQSQLRFLDNCNLSLTLDDRLKPDGNYTYSLSVETSKLLFRVSYQDIKLINILLTRVRQSTSSNQNETTQKQVEPVKRLPGSLSQRIRVSLGGIQAVLIDDLDDLHLPIFEFIVGDTVFDMIDWSLPSYQFDTSMMLDANYFNIKNSHWEPMIEKFMFSIHGQLGLQDDPSPDTCNITFLCRKKLEINCSHILMDTVFNFLQKFDAQSTRTGIRRENRSPYRIRNHTGYPIVIWTDSSQSNYRPELVNVENGKSIDWKFDDWRTMREQTAPIPNKFAIQIEGPSWETLKGITVDREGTTLYDLRPAMNNVLHKLVVDIKLRDKVKVVTLRSSKLIENGTNIDIELAFAKSGSKKPTTAATIKPGEIFAIPIESSYYDSIFVRPANFGYNWSSQGIYWRDLVGKKRNRVYLINCPSYEPSIPYFNFQLNCAVKGYDKQNPEIIMTLLAPFILENLLPYDFKYIIQDRNDRQQHSSTLNKGTRQYLHTLDPTHLLALNISIRDLELSQKDGIIITSTDLEYRDEHLVVKDKNQAQLTLQVKYDDSNSNGRVVSIYSPYLIVNKTSLDMFFSASSLISTNRLTAGQGRPRDKDVIEPLMFSYSNFEPLRSRAQVRTRESEWSKAMSFETVGSSFRVVLPVKGGVSLYLGGHIEEGLGKFYMSKVVTFSPRFMIQNNMDVDMMFGQMNILEPITLKSGECLPLLRLRNDTDVHELNIKFATMLSNWSNPFTITEIGTVFLKLGRIGSLSEDLVKVEIAIEKATFFITFTKETGKWPFRIDNDISTDVAITYSQMGSTTTYTVMPGEEQPYAWDFPSSEYKAISVEINGRHRPVEITQLGPLLPFRYPIDGTKKSAVMAMEVVAEGPTLVLKLTPFDPKKSAFQEKTSDRSLDLKEDFVERETQSKVLNVYRLRLEGVGISFISRDTKEILYATIKTFNVIMVETEIDNILTVSMKWIQVDNQINGAANPIFVYPSVLPVKEKEKSDPNSNGEKPVLLASFCRSKDTSYGVEYYKWLTVLLQELSIDLDAELLEKIMDFTKFDSSKEIEYQDAFDTSPTIKFPHSSVSSERMYFEKFLLQPVQINISYAGSDNSQSSNRHHTGALKLVYDILTVTVGNIHDAPIQLNALELSNPIFSRTQFIDLIMKFYSNEIFSQIYRLAGSADFLGNPVGLFNNVASGVKDMFYEPIKGFEITKPDEFGIGVAKGATSLMKKTVFGFSDTVSKFAGTIGKGLTVITMDAQFQNSRRLASRNRPKHVGQGIASGGASLVRGFASGVSGIVSQPLQGAKEAGVEGFFMGIGKGLLGVVAKPVVGIADLVTNVSEGIRNTTTVFDDELDKQRLPRFIKKDGILRSFNDREALGQHWLRGLSNSKYFAEIYICHLEMRIDDLAVIITEKRVLMMHYKRLKIEYDVKFDDIRKIERRGTEILLSIKGEFDNTVIPCPDEESAIWLLKNIETTYGDFILQSRPYE